LQKAFLTQKKLATEKYLIIQVPIEIGDILASFIVLGNWTEQGIRNVAEAPNRIKTTHSMVEKAGGKMQLYYTLGEYDFVMVVEVSSDEAMAGILACLGSMGNVRTKTLKAWTEEEGAKILTAAHP
jgi:uncharacterized protein with GYD domain